MRHIEERKPPVMLLMDRLMNYYGPAVFVAAALAGVGWFAYVLASGGGLAEAVPRSIYVALTTVLMGNPCALGITTPMVLAIGGGKGIARGLLVKAGEFFQALSDVDTVVFDKTGTLTYGKPTVKEVLAWGMGREELLSLAAAAEKPSEHPLGKAIVRFAQFQGVDDGRQATDFQPIPGKGSSAGSTGGRCRSASERSSRAVG